MTTTAIIHTIHCEGCGELDPETEDSYTLCCNEPTVVVSSAHRPASKARCVCGGEIVYYDSARAEGYGCDVEGEPSIRFGA